MRREDEGQAAVSGLRDRVADERGSEAAVHFTLLPGRLQAERVRKASRRKCGVGELPYEPGEFGHLVIWLFGH